jgi:hydrogenase maturation protein HypF
VGRLFDAIAALCGLRARINYEGQAAIELEAACDPGERGSYPISVDTGGRGICLDPRETVLAAAADAAGGAAPGTIASRFHEALARATVRACALAAAAHGTELVVLSGGVFANRRLLARVSDGLDRAGLRVLVPERLPVGDGGISYGQVAVAARRMAAGLVEGA